MLLVTGGAGFIGANFVQHHGCQSQEAMVVLDKLTYASNPSTIQSLIQSKQITFVQGDIADSDLVGQLLAKYRPRAVVHFAAETHVDRSIANPHDFVQTNLVGTFQLLEATRCYWQTLSEQEKNEFRFLHISTDEVYGSLSDTDLPFTESTPYAPNSPYSASKAGSDHLVRAYHHTYGLPTLITHCSNNYGPYQFPEKLIPLMITNALAEKPLPIYGDGTHVRDWLFVVDHCRALMVVLAKGRPGESYNIGGHCELTNLQMVTLICQRLDMLKPKQQGSYAQQIVFVTDRLGHDKRYAIDTTKLTKATGWRPLETMDTGLTKTIQWYLQNNMRVAQHDYA